MPTRFIELAGEVNTSMPEYVVRKVIDALNELGKPLRGSKVCVLGVAYKKDVDDPRESPSFVLMKLLRAGGAMVNYNDPYVPRLPKMRHHNLPDLADRVSMELTPEFLAGQDCILIATDHSSYDYDAIVRHAALVIDTRNATKNVTEGRWKIHKA
jgi:UDP-N-acetyl-D-glucosamine dehydrogenase